MKQIHSVAVYCRDKRWYWEADESQERPSGPFQKPEWAISDAVNALNFVSVYYGQPGAPYPAMPNPNIKHAN